MTDLAKHRAIKVNYELTASRQKVWRALTEPEFLERWLMPNDIAPRVGHRFTFRTQPAPGFDGLIHCEILEAVAPERLVYSWRGGPINTTVIWTLLEGPGGGTQLSLIQEGFLPEDGFTYEMLEKGWRDKASGPLERLAASL
jgi:uncharacterized protein YndB with AHSA1/START domain